MLPIAYMKHVQRQLSWKIVKSNGEVRITFILSDNTGQSYLHGHILRFYKMHFDVHIIFDTIRYAFKQKRV